MSVLTVPTRAVIAFGSGSASTELNAFDEALLDAGIGNLNLVRVSSVLPIGAEVLELSRHAIELPSGCLVPAVYARVVTQDVGTTVSSAIGIGIPADPRQHGMIFEATVASDAAAAERQVELMLREGFRARGTEMDRALVRSSEARCDRVGGYACATAAVLLLP
jgi:arginine decarboxylase